MLLGEGGRQGGLLNLTRMMSPVNSGSKSSVEPGWTFPVEKHLYRQEITDQTPGKGEFEAMPRSAISCSFTPSISLHATLDHILLVESFEHFHDLQLAISVVSFNLRIGCHPGEYPRKSSSKKDQPVLILFVCFLQLIDDLCTTMDNAMMI